MERKLSFSKKLSIFFLVFTLFAIAVVAFHFWQTHKTLISAVRNIDIVQFREYIASYGLLAPIALFVLQALQAVIPILPGSVITIAGGILFTPWIGAIISYFGALTGAVMVFFVSKYFGREFVEWLFHKEDLGAYDKIFQNNGFLITTLLRAVPFIDFGFASYLISISSIGFKEYFFGTAIGLIPTVLIYSYYGSLFLKNPILSSILGVVFLVLFLITPYLMRRFSKN